MSSESNAFARGPIGPQKNKGQSQAIKNQACDEVMMTEGDLECEPTPLKSASSTNDSTDEEEEIDSSDPQFHAKQIQRKFK